MLHLHGIGHSHPDNELSNAFLEALDIGTSDEWIVQRTGIRSRRTVLSLDYIRETKNRDVRAANEAVTVTNAELGRRAAELALARAGIDRTQLDLVVAGGSVPETVTPAEACNVAAALDLDVPAFDVRSACTSFGAILCLLDWMQAARAPRFALVVVPETVTRAVNYGDRRAAVLWGDGAAAAVVSPLEPGRAQITTNTLCSSPRGHDKVVVPWAGHFEQEGAAVQSFAIKTTSRLLRAAQQRHPDHALHFIGHQANLRMLQSVCRSCGIPEERHHHNVTRFGNTASAGSPSVLSERWERFQPGDAVAVVGVGSGLTWTDAVLTFGPTAHAHVAPAPRHGRPAAHGTSCPG